MKSKKSSPIPTQPQQNKPHFNETETSLLIEFAQILKEIHVRLLQEGYTIKGGKISKEQVE